ncbi:DegT/DnrJ/EryC1/StrS family aminotransferase [Methylobacterium phyllosphaerae]
MLTLPLATETWDDAELQAIERVLKSRRFTMGEEVRSFEIDFAKTFGSRFAIMTNSGSSANLLMLSGLLYHPRKLLTERCEIIVPTVSWSTTYYPINQLNMDMRFVDIDITTLNSPVESIREAITERTRAVLAVNLLGNPCQLDKIKALCDEFNILLIEDNCESMGASLNGKFTGTFGICGSFSTYFSHHISTMEGGLVVTDDEELYHTMLSLRAHGWLREQPKHSHLYQEIDEFNRSFRFVLPGYNLRPLEMSGAIGKEQLRKLPGFVEHRRKNADRFTEIFCDQAFAIIQREIGKSSWFGFSLVLGGALEGRRAEVVRFLNKAGIETRPIVSGNFLANPVIEHLRYTISGGVSNAERVDRDGLFIGNHHYEIGPSLVEAFDILQEIASVRLR